MIKTEKALKRARELFTPIYKYAKIDQEEGGPRIWWTMTEIKRICHWRLKGHKKWGLLRSMLEKELGLIQVSNGTPRCYSFPTSKEDNLKSVLVALAVEIGHQTRTSFLLSWRSDPVNEYTLGAEELELLADKISEVASRLQNRLRFLASRTGETKQLDEGGE